MRDGLLIVAVAGNITDSLSVHMYQEAEELEARAAFRAMLMNFVARLLIGLTFAIVVLVLPNPYAAIIALGWGLLLLVGLSFDRFHGAGIFRRKYEEAD